MIQNAYRLNHDFGALDRTYTGNHFVTLKQRIIDLREQLVLQLIEENKIDKKDIQQRLRNRVDKGRSYFILDDKYWWKEVSKFENDKLTITLVPFYQPA